MHGRKRFTFFTDLLRQREKPDTFFAFIQVWIPHTHFPVPQENENDRGIQAFCLVDGHHSHSIGAFGCFHFPPVSLIPLLCVFQEFFQIVVPFLFEISNGFEKLHMRSFLIMEQCKNMKSFIRLRDQVIQRQISYRVKQRFKQFHPDFLVPILNNPVERSRAGGTMNLKEQEPDFCHE